MATRSELLRDASRQELGTVIIVLCRSRLVPLVEAERLLLDIRLDRTMARMQDAARRLPSLQGEARRLCQAHWDRARAGHERALALRYPEQLRTALAKPAEVAE